MTDIMKLLKKIDKDGDVLTVFRNVNTVFAKWDRGNNVFQFEFNDEEMVTENITIRIVNVAHGEVDKIMIPLAFYKTRSEIISTIKNIMDMYTC